MTIDSPVSVDKAPNFSLSIPQAYKDRFAGLTGIRRLEPGKPMNLTKNLGTGVIEVGGEREVDRAKREKGVVQVILKQVRDSGVRFRYSEPDEGSRSVKNTGTEPIYVVYQSGKTDNILPGEFYVHSSKPLQIAWDTGQDQRVAVHFNEVWNSEKNFENHQMSFSVTGKRK